ncbi:chemotaxis protein CheX [Clostridium oryzae]|uniref:CheY-P phosphatase CheX n=1 Tax=Clostridium oryzae TaxID=1450648 RepID=A0A1V4IW89_9CLOT|nr:chemotaxis protein CheX [Clostridium oryzae]OPJ64206.1 CheY-P phosphatase CheX [Clostridium oryzae]
MKSEYIDSFVQATQSVTEMLFGTGVKHEKPYLRNSVLLSNQVVVMIGVIGKIKGQVSFELPIDTAKKIASVMMGGMEVTELDDISKSAVSEMGNMIMGNASTIFAGQNINIDITPPTLLMGEKIEISNKAPNIIAPLELEAMGTILISIAVEEAA